MADALQQKHNLIGCPKCDAVYRLRVPAHNQCAACRQCGHTLILGSGQATARLLSLSLAVLILVVAAAFFPFLSIDASGVSNRVSVLDVATSFRSGWLVLVSVATVLFIVALPALRMSLLIYVLLPLSRGRRAPSFARDAFRLAQALKAWTMTEIFALGCAVALVKVADLAQLEFGPAFWMFMVLAVITIAADRQYCAWSIWRAIDTDRQSR